MSIATAMSFVPEAGSTASTLSPCTVDVSAHAHAHEAAPTTSNARPNIVSRLLHGELCSIGDGESDGSWCVPRCVYDGAAAAVLGATAGLLRPATTTVRAAGAVLATTAVRAASADC